MMAAVGAVDLMDFLPEPVFVLCREGIVAQANRAARRLLGDEPAGRDLAELIASPVAGFRDWLRRCSGTTSPLVGSIAFRTGSGGDARFRAYGARLADAAGDVRIAVRCVAVRRSAFSVLARQVDALNVENRRRQQREAVLEEALAANTALLRELHHRAKNNIQLMHGWFAAAQREAGSVDVRDFLEGARRRLLAMGAAQQLMYRPQQMATIPADTFVRSLCEAIASTFDADVEIRVAADEADLPNDAAFPLALILNELLANAFAHGLRGGAGTIGVTLERTAGEIVLTVSDSGGGFTVGEPRQRASGLGLVQGLCRQIGGRLSVDATPGTRVTVAFADEADAAGPAA